MNHPSPLESHSKLILRGIRFLVTPELQASVETSAGRLMRHEPSIDRLRINLRRDQRGRAVRFTAKGRIEIAGPDLSASVVGRDPLQAIKLLVAKLDRMLRKRTTAILQRRTSGDIRHAAAGLKPAPAV